MLAEADRVLYSGHARHEMCQEEFDPLTDQELYETICTGPGQPRDTLGVLG
jgi:hypothetical protein